MTNIRGTGRDKKVVQLMWHFYPLLTLVTVSAGLLSGLATIQILDTITTAIQRPHIDFEFAWVFGAWVVVQIAAQCALLIIPAYVSAEVITLLRRGIFSQILDTKLEHIEMKGAGEILTLLTNDIPTVARSVIILPVILADLAVCIFGIAYIAHLSIQGFAAFAIGLGVGLVLYRQFYLRAIEFTRKARSEYDVFHAHVQSLLHGIKELKLNATRRRWFKRADLDFSGRRVGKFGFYVNLWFIGGNNTGQLIQYMVLAMLVFGFANMQGDRASLISCVFAVVFLMGPLTSLVNAMPTAGQGNIALEKLSQFGFDVNSREALLRLESNARQPHEPTPDWAEIELKQVCAGYTDRSNTEFFLGPISISLKPGEVVFLVGGNGSGKSTLAKVLSGLYAPSSGAILLDGRPIGDAELERYRSLFSTVFSDFFVFPRIQFGGESNALHAEFDRRLDLFDLKKKVCLNGSKLSSATALSLGQRKRLALLVALMEERPIILLDEWAADQEPEFRHFFYTRIIPELKKMGKCLVLITHDEQYFNAADRLIKLRDGAIVL